MRPAGPVAALAASALALGAASPDRLTEVHVALVGVSAQPNPRTGGVPTELRKNPATRWRVSYTVRGKTRSGVVPLQRPRSSTSLGASLAGSWLQPPSPSTDFKREMTSAGTEAVMARS